MTATTPAANTTSKKKIYIKQTADGKYLLFGANAEMAAKVLGLTAESTRGGKAKLELPTDQFGTYKTQLEEANYEVMVELMRPSITRKDFTGGSLLFGDEQTKSFLEQVATALGLQVGMTAQQKPMLRLTAEQMEQAIGVLGESVTINLVANN